MLIFIQQIVPFCEFHHVASYHMIHHLASNAGEADWSVIFRFTLVTFLKLGVTVATFQSSGKVADKENLLEFVCKLPSCHLDCFIQKTSSYSIRSCGLARFEGCVHVCYFFSVDQ